MYARLLLSLALSLPCLVGAAQQEVDPATAQQLLQKLEAMEKRISQLETEVSDLREENQRLQTTADTAAPPALAEASKAAPAKTAQTEAAPTVVQKSATDASVAASKGTPAAVQVQAPPAAQLSIEKLPSNVPQGFIPVWGTDAYVKFSLTMQADVIGDTNNANSPGEFVTSALPVFGQNDYGGGPNATISFRQSTLAFQGILETGHGPLNVQYANNFFANASTSQYGYYLLRFYGEWEGLRIGYGYSAMTDENAIPATLDYEGPNSLIITYNAQIRYTRALLDLGDAELVGLASLEAASPSVTNANSTDQRAPDIIAGAALRGDDWHVQATGVLSSFSSQTAVGTSDALGWGLSLSGAWNFTEDDELMAWASGGSGYANYLQDVSGLGLDAYVDASGQLQTIGAWGFGVGYEHSWTDAVSSTFTIGYINIDDENTGGVINPFVMHETYYASGNVVWQIFPELTVGAELLYGRKRAINGSDGDDFRLQITTRYSFNP